MRNAVALTKSELIIQIMLSILGFIYFQIGGQNFVFYNKILSYFVLNYVQNIKLTFHKNS